MATEWYWCEEEKTCGPVSFQELVGMVRGHVLDEDDLVRPDYQAAWQRVETVVGLSYMAFRVRRSPVDPDEPKPVVSSTTDSDELLDEESGLSALTLEEAVSKHRGLGNFQGTAGPLAAGELEDHELTGAESALHSEDGAATGNSFGEWSSAVAAAVEHFDRRHNPDSATTGSRLSRLWSATTGTSRIADEFGGWSRVSRMAVVLLATISTGNGVAWGLLSWSDHEQLRFPSRHPDMGLPIFPIVGRCSEFEYWLLFGHAVLFMALGVFFTSRWLCNKAE